MVIIKSMLVKITFLMTVYFGSVLTARTRPARTFEDYSQQFLKLCENYVNQVKDLPGYDQLEDKGELASPKEFPFTVILGYGSGVLTLWLCGGTLISTKYVLSAAHCARHPMAGPATTALLGELDGSTNDDETTSRYVDITLIINHPQYREGGKLDNLALFQLENEAPVSFYIRPACLLARRRDDELKHVWAPGWGTTPDDPFAIVENLHMRKGKNLAKEVEFDCDDSIESSIAREKMNKLICFSEDLTYLPCQSDSGGGLLSSDEVNGVSVMNLIGIRTDRNCTKRSLLFLDLKFYLPWIAQHIFEN